MKKILIVAILIAGVLMVFGCAKKVDIAAETSQVKAIIDQYVKAIETEDVTIISQLVAPAPDVVFVGTNPGEVYYGWASIQGGLQKQFADAESTKLEVKEQVIKVDTTGDTAWFWEAADLSMMYKGKPFMVQGLRITGVLEKKEGKWLLVHSHMSMPFVEVIQETKKEEPKAGDKKTENKEEVKTDQNKTEEVKTEQKTQ